MIGEHERIGPLPVGKFIEPSLTPASRMRTPCSTTTISARLVDAVESSVLSEIRPAPSAWGRHYSSACKVSDPSTIPVEAQGPASPGSMILGTKGTVSNPLVHLVKKTRIRDCRRGFRLARGALRVPCGSSRVHESGVVADVGIGPLFTADRRDRAVAGVDTSCLGEREEFRMDSRAEQAEVAAEIRPADSSGE